MSAGFLSVLSQAQRYVTERVQGGEPVIDATTGNGVDTLFLAKLSGPRGAVFAFDVQAAALERTRARLANAASAGERLARVELLLAGHEEMNTLVPSEYHGRIAAIMFNLGYLPGADRRLTTKTDTTLIALVSALMLLRGGGLLTIVVYPGHEGGDAEASAVEQWASTIPPMIAQCVVYRFPQKNASPYLIAIVKK
ncbi:tRNA (mnm(5)s(2)U34)-methyltransferase [Cohnella panacarvi]|uniref:tRNA (mnm(5)s(2)U34)-methyltransferase n=1 Tax=Cohnella panacarvi TaxID=400776 RepID=UPI00047BC1F2|nr:class I SAM-dependent methyltransferase [Cohnella panacarvi]